jgi:hypothetical protein
LQELVGQPSFRFLDTPNKPLYYLCAFRACHEAKMSPRLLAIMVSDLEKAAEVVEAIDDRERQKEQGWDLEHWQYELIPWGVRFRHFDPFIQIPSFVKVVLPVIRRQETPDRARARIEERTP